MDTELQTLLAMKDRLAKQVDEAIQSLPEKRQLDAVTLLIESQNVQSMKGSSEPIDSDFIMENVIAHFKSNRNTPSSMPHIVDAIRQRGVKIDSARPGATIGAIMTRSHKWKDKFKNENGLWSLKE